MFHTCNKQGWNSRRKFQFPNNRNAIHFQYRFGGVDIFQSLHNFAFDFALHCKGASPAGYYPFEFTNSKQMLPHDLCVRIQNAFRARHQKIAVFHTKQNLGILSILLRAGFISNITRGTVTEPSPAKFLEAGVAQRRIWADLKYRDERPVLHNMELVSKPSLKVHLSLDEIKLICTGRRVHGVKALGMGEVAVIHTADKDFEWLEAREALRMNMGGEVVCRAK